jgi:hypothetical protein
MRFKDDPESSFKVIEMLHAHRFAHQSRYPLPPFVVEPFHDAGFSAAFVTGPVLPRRKQLGIDRIKVAAHQLFAIVSRQRKPKLPQTLKTTVSNPKANHLMGQTRDGQPQILVAPLLVAPLLVAPLLVAPLLVAPLETETNHQLVHLQGITLEGRQERLGKIQTALLRLF